MRKNKIEEIIRELQATGQGTRLTAMDKALVCAHLTEERELSTFQAADSAWEERAIRTGLQEIVPR